MPGFGERPGVLRGGVSGGSGFGVEVDNLLHHIKPPSELKNPFW